VHAKNTPFCGFPRREFFNSHSGYHHVSRVRRIESISPEIAVVEVENPFVVLLGSIGFWNAR
jgi:hypothetical protein